MNQLRPPDLFLARRIEGPLTTIEPEARLLLACVQSLEVCHRGELAMAKYACQMRRQDSSGRSECVRSCFIDK